MPVQVEKELLDELEKKLDENITVEEIDPIGDEELGDVVAGRFSDLDVGSVERVLEA